MKTLIITLNDDKAKLISEMSKESGYSISEIINGFIDLHEKYQHNIGAAQTLLNNVAESVRRYSKIVKPRAIVDDLGNRYTGPKDVINRNPGLKTRLLMMVLAGRRKATGGRSYWWE